MAAQTFSLPSRPFRTLRRACDDQEDDHKLLRGSWSAISPAPRTARGAAIKNRVLLENYYLPGDLDDALRKRCSNV